MKTKAFVKNSTAKRDVAIRTLTLPDLQIDECVVKVEGVGICGSDLHMFDGHAGYDWVNYPLVLGHEVTGKIIEVGSVENTQLIGKQIVVDPYISCGSCEFCLKGQPNRCDRGEFKTIKTPIDALQYGFRRAGGMAEKMVIKVDNALIIDEKTNRGVAAISEALAVSYTAVKKILDYDTKKILIVGPGPIGLGAAAVLIGSGNEQVDMLGTSVDEQRLQLAKEIGCATIYMDTKHIDMEKMMGYDAIIDCSGHPTVPKSVIPLLKRGGELILVGINAQEFAIPMDQIVRGEIQLKGSYGITRKNLQQVLKMAMNPNYPFEKLIAEEVPFEEIITGFEKALNKAVGKIVITF